MPKRNFIGKCIYGGCSTPPLSDEHTVPYGLNGDTVLEEASCQKCAQITSTFESVVLRETLSAARAALGAKTRRPKQRNQHRPMHIIVDGQEQRIERVTNWEIHPILSFEFCTDGHEFTDETDDGWQS
jgi:hypothetical protein